MQSRILSLLITSAAVVGMTSSVALAQTRAVSPTKPAAATQAPVTPAPATATTPAAAPAPAPAPTPAINYTPFTAPTPAVDIVATLTAAGKFSTLLKAIDAAGLTPVLKQPGALTLFAPPDEAFAALPAGTLDDLLKPENRTKLQRILLYHAINALVTTAATLGHAASDVPTVVPGATPPLTLHVDGSSGSLKINDANVVQADVKASNGTVQVIDKVLMPAG